MKISAKKVVTVYAEVTYNGCDYRVWPNGVVERWEPNEWNTRYDWYYFSDCKHGYDEIKAAGLRCLETE